MAISLQDLETAEKASTAFRYQAVEGFENNPDFNPLRIFGVPKTQSEEAARTLLQTREAFFEESFGIGEIRQRISEIKKELRKYGIELSVLEKILSVIEKSAKLDGLAGRLKVKIVAIEYKRDALLDEKERKKSEIRKLQDLCARQAAFACYGDQIFSQARIETVSPNIDDVKKIIGSIDKTIPLPLQAYLSIFENHPFFETVYNAWAKSVLNEEAPEVIDEIRKYQAVYKERKDAVQKGDKVEIDFTGYDENGGLVENTRSKNHMLFVGEGRLVWGFEEELIGIKVGEKKTFRVTLPKDFHEESLRGKPVKFEVNMKKAESVTLPEIDSAFISRMMRNDKSRAKFHAMVGEDHGPKVLKPLELIFRMEREKLRDVPQVQNPLSVAALTALFVHNDIVRILNGAGSEGSIDAQANAQILSWAEAKKLPKKPNTLRGKNGLLRKQNVPLGKFDQVFSAYDTMCVLAKPVKEGKSTGLELAGILDDTLAQIMKHLDDPFDIGDAVLLRRADEYGVIAHVFNEKTKGGVNPESIIETVRVEAGKIMSDTAVDMAKRKAKTAKERKEAHEKEKKTARNKWIDRGLNIITLGLWHRSGFWKLLALTGNIFPRPGGGNDGDNPGHGQE